MASGVVLQTGKTIQRAPRKRGAKGATLPSKPEGGWPILVTPLHAGGKRGKPFVALPDTTQRALTADEELYLSHFKIEVWLVVLLLSSELVTSSRTPPLL